MARTRGSDWLILVPLLLLLLVVGLGAVLWQRWTPPRLVEQQVREVVYSTIQQEAGASFYVTGHIDVAIVTTVEDTPVLFPGVLDLRLGTTSATVRVPGRVSYGFDAAMLRPEMIRFAGDTVDITLPELAVYSTEPDLSELEVQTRVGWARLRTSGQEAERRAVRHLTDGLRQQGVAHLRDSIQPRVNTARALEELLTPVLQAAGAADPHFRFRLGDGIVVEGGSRVPVPTR
jgi:hypothetical protein